MIKKFYIFAWLLLVVSVLLSTLNNSMSGLQMVTFSLIGAGLVYAFALWAVLARTRDTQAE